MGLTGFIGFIEFRGLTGHLLVGAEEVLAHVVHESISNQQALKPCLLWDLMPLNPKP